MKLDLTEMEAIILEGELKLALESWEDVPAEDETNAMMNESHIEDLRGILRKVTKLLAL